MTRDHLHTFKDELHGRICTFKEGEADQLECRTQLVEQEIHDGLALIEQFDRSVTFFGSARLQEGNKYYDAARRMAHRLAQKQFAIVSGGGPGIMEAANRGAHEAGGDSIGMTIQLPFEQTSNDYVEHEMNFYYFFTRKMALAYSAEAYVYFPGGFGTMDELFELLTLIQTHKVGKVPVFLYGTSFWQPLMNFITEQLRDEHQTISAGDENIFTITDDEDLIVESILKAPVHKGAF